MTAPNFSADFQAALIAAVEARDGKRKGDEITFTCPSHEDKHPSARYNFVKKTWFCDPCGVGGGVIDLAKLLGVPQPERKTNNRRKDRSGIVWDIKDADGVIQARHEHKKRWLHPDGTPSKDGEIKPKRLPLYGTENLRLQHDGADVVVCEGEKDTKWLNVRSVRAVGTFGTSMLPSDDVLQSLMRFRISLWPDNDDVGRKHMQEIAAALHRLGHEDVHIIDWAEAPAKGGAADYRGNRDELHDLLDGAMKWAPPAAVDLADLLESVRSFITKYVVLTPPQADAVALWVVHTYPMGAWETTPYVEVTSAEKRSGKTLLLETAEHVVANGWLTGRTSAAALVRKMGEGVTALIDESDAAFKGPQEYSEALRGILNNGHRRSGKATLCVGQGAKIEVKDFPVFGAKMIAGIGRLPDTISDRSITITMKRRSASEKVERWRYRIVKAEGEPIRAALAAWAPDAVPILEDARPEIPQALDDRAADGWEPLLAIAELAGGDWPEKARAAAIALSCGDDREDSSMGVRLLGDIQNIVEAKEKISIAELVEKLVAIEDAPWGDLYDKPLTTQGLGWRLRPFGVKAKSIKLHGETKRGYEREQFAEVFARYLGETDTHRYTVTPDTETGNASCGGNAFETVTDEETDTGSRYESNGITVRNGSYRDEGDTCTICGDELDGDGGYTSDGSPRCQRHFIRETDGPLVARALEMGLGIDRREQVHQ